MNHEQAFQLVGQANPLPGDSSGQDGFLSMTALLDRIDERSTDVQTQERPRTERREPSNRRPRWLIPALAGAVVVIIAIVLGTLVFTGGSEQPDVIEPAPTPTTVPDVVGPSALEVMDLHSQAVAAADWAALRGLYADTAEFEVNSETGESFLVRIALADLVPQTPYDWDGDGLIDGFDALIDDAGRVAAHGATAFVSCSPVDNVTLACTEVWEGHAFMTPDTRHNFWTVTIVDGLISTQVLELVERLNPVDTDLVFEYNRWISVNRPELEADLFEDIRTLAVSPDTVPVHRELIAEWQATTRTAADVGAALNAAAVAGDWQAVVALFDEDATVTLGPGTLEFEGSSNPRGSNGGFGPTNPTEIGDFLTGGDWLGSFRVVDWNNDGRRSGFDSVAQDTMIGWAMGFSVFESCSAEDASTLVCVGAWDAHPFPNPGRGEELAVHTVVDGLITDTTWNIEGVTGNDAVVDRIDANDYALWIEGNRAELTADTALFRENPGDPIRELIMTPETVEIHRQLIAEWLAER